MPSITTTREIDTGKLSTVIDKNWISGASMLAAQKCIHQMLYYYSDKGKQCDKYNVPKIEERINNTIKEFKMIGKGSYGYAYKLSFGKKKSLKVVVKIEKKQNYQQIASVLVEYYTGINVNNLRYLTPCFVYTYTLFECLSDKDKMCIKGNAEEPDKGQLNIMIEHIDGVRLNEYKFSNFGELLSVYIQLLAALDIGQQKMMFTHNDLHTNNVMIKVLKSHVKYSVFIGPNEYVFNTKLIPVIIDYGFVTILAPDKTLITDCTSPQPRFI